MEIIRFIQSFASPFWDKFFLTITSLGEDSFFVMIFALVFWCISKNSGYKLGFALYTSGLWNTVIKDIFRVPRPLGQLGIRTVSAAQGGGYSFPSGHAQNISTYITFIMEKLRKVWIYILGTMIIVLVAVSRLYLGVHVPTDVLGGIIIGMGWVFISNWIFDRFISSGKLLNLLIVLGVILIGLALFQSQRYLNCAGTITSILFGYYIDNKFINFQVIKNIWFKIIVFIFGILGLKYMYSLILFFQERNPVSFFLSGLFIGIWITVIVPLICKIALMISKRKRGEFREQNI